MKNLPSILAAALVVLILVFYMCTFQVRFTEVAIKETFGEPSESTLDEPGLYFKWPWPIQNVVKFDKRIRVLEDQTEETITADSKNVILATATLWTIEDPYLFHRRFARVEDGRKHLRNAIRSQKKAVVGQYDFSNFVSTVPGERKLAQMEREMMEPVRAVWRRENGVDIKSFAITKLALPESVTQAIFDSMKKNEQNKADNYQAEGKAKAQQIVASAMATKQRILAVATRKADEIRNDGQKRVSEIYEVFKDNQDLRIFLDKLSALEQAFRTHTTIIMDQRWPPVDLFQENLGKTVNEPDLELRLAPGSEAR